MAKNMEKESLNGQMAQNMMEIFMTITFKAKEFTLGKMAENMQVIGQQTKCMGKECSHGATGKDTKVTTLKTRKKVWDNLIGLMEKFIMDNGRMVNNMVKELQ